MGLNPVLLELAVGGDHNDTLLLLALAAALLFTAGASPRFRAGAAALVAGIGGQGHRRPGAAVPGTRGRPGPASARERLRVAAAAG